MLIIDYSDIPMCATCKFIATGVAHFSNGDKKVCVCRILPSKKVIFTIWYANCNLYSSVKCNNVTYIIDVCSK